MWASREGCEAGGPGSPLYYGGGGALCFCSPTESHFGGTRLPLVTRGFRKAGPSWVGSPNARPPGCCHSEAVPAWKSPTSCSCGSSWPARRHPPVSHAIEGNPRSEQGTRSGGQIQNASRPAAKASEDFRNCKRGHQLKSPRTGQKEEGTIKRKRVLLTAPTFSTLSLRASFLRLRGSAGSGEPLAATEPRGEPER